MGVVGWVVAAKAAPKPVICNVRRVRNHYKLPFFAVMRTAAEHMPSIYRKSAKGQAEIETRANKLPPRLRTALIMVDGKRSEAELRPLLLQAPEETLAMLLAQGFIEVVGTNGAGGQYTASNSAPAPTPQPATPPVAAPAQAPAPVPAGPPLPGAANGMRPMPLPLPMLQRDAVRLLTDQVGPMAEAVAMRIEKSRSTEELRAAVLLGAQVIANTRGRQAAEAYVARFADI